MRLSWPLSPRAAMLAAMAAVGVGSCTDGPTAPLPNAAPTVSFISPVTTALFSGGDTLNIAITASDREDGVLNGAAVTWWVDLHHDAHTHPFAPVTAGTTGRVGIPRVGHAEPSIFLRLFAAVRDSDGAVDTVSIDLLPRLTALTLQSQPSGLQVTLDGQPHSTPYTEQAVAGMRREVAALDPVELGASTYSFRDWVDGGGIARQVILPATPLTLTVRYDSIGPANAAPELRITAPTAGASYLENSTVPLDVVATDADGDAISVQYLFNGEVRATVAGPSFVASTAATPRGRVTVSAVATDARGKRRVSAPVEIVVQAADGSDVLPPDVGIISPAENSWDLSGSVAVEVTAVDNVGVSSVEFAVDDSVFAVDAAAPYSATLSSTAGFTSGVHDITVRARDAAGNWSPWVTRTVTFGGSQIVEQGFIRSTLVAGLVGNTTALAFAPDGLLFVSQQNGALRVIKNGTLLAEPYVTVPTTTDGERGLLGVAIDPDYVSTRWLYVFYTSRESGDGARNRIVRFTTDASGERAVAGSAVLIAELPVMSEETQKHNGGAMHFGLDGKLYLATGDLVTPGYPQALDNPFGKVLRFNRNGTIPTDNPFYGETTGINRAIWARGFRNPFTFAFDRETGRLHINDVGQGLWEEVNLGRAGANYGWPLTEGPTNAVGFDGPLWAFPHEAIPPFFGGTAVIGGAFYSGPGATTFGERFHGDYFIADFALGWIYRLDAGRHWAPSAFARLDAWITGLTVGPDGALYILAGGTVQRIGR